MCITDAAYTHYATDSYPSCVALTSLFECLYVNKNRPIDLMALNLYYYYFLLLLLLTL